MDLAKRRLRRMIGFSSLACPEWDASTVVEQAARMGFDGIEWRGGPDGHVMSLTAPQRAKLRQRTDDVGLAAISVTSYTSFVHPSAATRMASIDHAIRHGEVAADLRAPYVRVLPGPRVDGAPSAVLMDRLVDSLMRTAERMEGLGVVLALEPHDDLVLSSTLRPVLERVSGSTIRVIWEIGNAWIAGEDPLDGLPLLRPWLSYVQVKDGTGRGGQWSPTVLGAGDVPLGSAMRALVEADLRVPISIEWERPWYPHLSAANEALPDCLEKLRALLAP